jgi:dienelactone hydrolase
MDDITQRITATADRLADAGNDAVAADLYEVERALRNANRRLARVVASFR